MTVRFFGDQNVEAEDVDNRPPANVGLKGACPWGATSPQHRRAASRRPAPVTPRSPLRKTTEPGRRSERTPHIPFSTATAERDARFRRVRGGSFGKGFRKHLQHVQVIVLYRRHGKVRVGRRIFTQRAGTSGGIASCAGKIHLRADVTVRIGRTNTHA